jgi:hypothetical protein
MRSHSPFAGFAARAVLAWLALWTSVASAQDELCPSRPTYCERAMCNSNAIRACTIAEATGCINRPRNPLRQCPQCINTPAVVAAIAECNSNQDFLSTTCTINGKEVYVNYNYDLSTCADAVPAQLEAAGLLVIKAESDALLAVKTSKGQDSVGYFQTEQAKCGTEPVEPACICTAVTEEDRKACRRTIRQTVFTQEPFFSDYASQYDAELVANLLSLGVFETEAEAQAFALESCQRRFPGATSGLCESGTNPSPPPARRMQ